jgi:arylsulfatase A-like enzyme
MHKTKPFLGAIWTGAALCGAGALYADSTPPNVVLILVDDLGYGDLSCYGATRIHTPNIDQLAAEGRRFSDAHSASAVCTPSRYALLTGQYPLRADHGKGVWGPLPISSGLIIDTESLTLADVFKNKGYATAALGKWHLGFKTGSNNWELPLRPGPQDLGFDYYFGIPVVSSAAPYVYVENDHLYGGDPADPLIPLSKGHDNEATPIVPLPKEASQRSGNQFKGAVEAHKLYDPYMAGTVLAGKAVEWISANQQKPFFLYLATPHIHHPFTPAPQFQGSSQAGLYGDYIQELDWMVGQVTKCLADNGLSDNTLVIFTSDNGGMFNTGAQDAFKLGHRQNGDLLGFKFGIWEGGHRIPFIARWPGKIEAGSESKQLLCLVDMLATCLALTDQDFQSLENKDSVNMLPALLENPAENLRTELLLAPRRESNLSIRRNQWMYIPAKGSGGFTGSKPGEHGFSGPAACAFTGHPNSDIENGKISKDAPRAQLYNLEADVNQTQNLYNDYPEVVQEMAALLKTYAPARPGNASPKKGPKAVPVKKGKAAATLGPAPKTAAVPSARSASFDFESGTLEPWTVMAGAFGHTVGNRAEFFNNNGAFNKQGTYYLTTLETSADAESGSDVQTGVLVSPLFIPAGGSLTFRVGGGSGPSTYVALCTEDGTEVCTANGINAHQMQSARWDLTPYAGQKMFLKVVDQSKSGWGHITADDFEFDGEILTSGSAEEEE